MSIIANASNLFALGMGIATYVLMSVGLFTIARNRGLHHPWLAWIPVANWWVLGCISDQYRYVTQGREQNSRRLLLIFSITNLVLPILLVIVSLFTMGDFFRDPATMANLMAIFRQLLGIAGAVLLLFVIYVLFRVFQCMALYDLFSSCQPSEKTLFLVLTILGYLFSLPVLPALLVCVVCNKEDGMPPRIPTEAAVVDHQV